MGREVLRVPGGFSWPVGKAWFGFVLDSIACELCGGTGKAPQGKHAAALYGDRTHESDYCDVCQGGGIVSPTIEVPKGPAWQMWENVSEGSPISPACESKEALARWLADNAGKDTGTVDHASYEEWLATIEQGGCPSMAMIPGVGVVDGPRIASVMAPEQGEQ